MLGVHPRTSFSAASKRLDYVNAVKCLQKLPARTPKSVAAGAKSRFDDFVVTHLLQTRTIHYNGYFQPWHRWFIYEYERALRKECGYKGYQPYWDWPKYSSAPQDSPIFNGDPYSLGGNGEFIANLTRPSRASTDLPLPGKGARPRGVGGGFVTTGPFANITINVGPGDNVAYNPRRIKRDVGPGLNTRYANYTTVLNLLQKPNVDEFRSLSEGVLYTDELGPHVSGHGTITGASGGVDFFNSPGDPAFYTHHGMMDRMWTLWQAMDPETRRDQLGQGLYSHVTWANIPPSRVVSLTDVLSLGFAGRSTQIADVMDTLSGPLCYFYL
ncbi:Tyrosinase [Purpureocillium takamizusanense]|uniref:Tyrosinase n=1 Tax=Purpureocillium takamizusanense TaxID=2060973 RepID=A0A9Q8QL99_9HYPO|nr:Tyrosinase [Purpureocillium takamizusanense]UNI21818.1 Tyrosinase [Purpureocillium takamizusanense]